MSTIRNYDYDQRNDILYVHYTNDKGESYAEEQQPGIYFMKDMETDEMTGLMIFGPKSRYLDRSRSLASLGLESILSYLSECLVTA